ncbi:MAG: hypothetical protein Fur0010_03360 [Bdellovibrio sp.]
MKIDASKAYEQKKEINNLVKDQRTEIIKREQELAGIRSLYDQKKEDQKIQGEKELIEIHDNNQKRLLEAVDGQNEKLEEMRTNLILTKEMLDKEQDRLTKTHQDKIQDINNYYNEKFKTQFNEGEEVSKDINHKVNLHIKDINSETDRNILKTQNETGLKLNKIEYENSLKVKSIEDNYARLRGRMELENSKALMQTEREHQKLLNEQLKKQTREAAIKDQIHKDQVKNQEVYYNDLIKQKDIAFKQKVEAMTKAHEMVLTSMKQKYQHELDSIVKAHAERKKLAESKAKDPFYRMETLDPVIKDFGDHYQVAIDIPEGEKENVNLTAGKRKITIGFARRFQNRMEDLDKGVVYHTARSEGSRKEIPVADIVDSQHIEKKYQDGQLIFKVKKA